MIRAKIQWARSSRQNSSGRTLGNKTNSSVTEFDPIPEKRGRKTILGQTKNAGVAISLSQLEAFSSSSSAITPFIGHSPVAWQRQLSQEEREGNPRKTERCCKAAIRLNFAEIRSLSDRRVAKEEKRVLPFFNAKRKIWSRNIVSTLAKGRETLMHTLNVDQVAGGIEGR
jgi:hypothetical protein